MKEIFVFYLHTIHGYIRGADQKTDHVTDHVKAELDFSGHNHQKQKSGGAAR